MFFFLHFAIINVHTFENQMHIFFIGLWFEMLNVPSVSVIVTIVHMIIV